MSMDDKIYNCSNWAFRCPQTWHQLEKTDDSDIRFCNECQKKVFFCKDDEEVKIYSNKLFCVALNSNNTEEIEWVTLGVILPGDYQQSPLVSILLEPTYKLNNEQIRFLVNVFELKDNYINSRKILCDGQLHLLKSKVPQEIAEDIGKRLESRDISYRIKVEPDHK